MNDVCYLFFLLLKTVKRKVPTSQKIFTIDIILLLFSCMFKYRSFDFDKRSRSKTNSKGQSLFLEL